MALQGSISADTMDDYAVRLKKQFDKCDVDCSKLLEGEELVQMARWVWATFHPDGEEIDAEVRTHTTSNLPLLISTVAARRLMACLHSAYSSPTCG